MFSQPNQTKQAGSSHTNKTGTNKDSKKEDKISHTDSQIFDRDDRDGRDGRDDENQENSLILREESIPNGTGQFNAENILDSNTSKFLNSERCDSVYELEQNKKVRK